MFTYCKAFLVSIILSVCFAICICTGWVKLKDPQNLLNQHPPHMHLTLNFFQLIIKFYTIIYKNMSLKVCRHPAFGREVCTAPLKTSSMTTHKRRQWLQASFCALLHRCCLHGFSATQWGQSTVFHRAVLEFLPLIWWTADWNCRAEYAAL